MGDGHTEGKRAAMAEGEGADVLLVDFSDSVRKTSADILRTFGFTVEEADDGEIAYELLTQKVYRMVVLELDLPKRTAVEVLESLEFPPPLVIKGLCSTDRTR
jgi:DNA-binding response OmpR family regulator